MGVYLAKGLSGPFLCLGNTGLLVSQTQRLNMIGLFVLLIEANNDNTGVAITERITDIRYRR